MNENKLTDGPWRTSEPHPDTGMRVITNAQGRVIATGVPSKADADFICAARAKHWEGTILHMDWKAFGGQVSAVRKAKNMPQDVAAEMCGISRNYMSMIERGTATDPAYMIVLMLCLWLDLELPKPDGWIG